MRPDTTLSVREEVVEALCRNRVKRLRGLDVGVEDAGAGAVPLELACLDARSGGV